MEELLTYFVDVPVGTSQLTFQMHGDLDFALAVKHGSAILDYGSRDDGGDRDYRDNDVSSGATIVVSAPARTSLVHRRLRGLGDDRGG